MYTAVDGVIGSKEFPQVIMVCKQIGVLGDESDGGSAVLPLDWSQWLNEFLSRLFTLLVHLEPSSQS